MKKTAQVLTVCAMALLLFGGLLLHILVPDRDVSAAERRKLTRFPEFSGGHLLSGQYGEDLEAYLLDQFPGRDVLRTVKSVWSYYVLRQKDNNGIVIGADPYSQHTTVAKLEPHLDEKQVAMFTEKFSSLRQKFFPDSPVTCVVIPDKMYYLTDGYPRMDYGRLLSMVEKGMPFARVCTNLFQSLITDSYYRTDSHWRQEKLQWVLEDLEHILQIELPDLDTYDRRVLPGFHGVYYGQAALPMAPEDLIYLENDVTRQAVVTGPELQGPQTVYAPERFSGMDGYDVFLHGAQAVLSVENTLAEGNRELIVFRDSYGSSLVPLLLPAYKTVTLVDIRYVNTMFLDQFVDFHGQDVLILYAATLINGASVLR